MNLNTVLWTCKCCGDCMMLPMGLTKPDLAMRSQIALNTPWSHCPTCGFEVVPKFYTPMFQAQAKVQKGGIIQ